MISVSQGLSSLAGGDKMRDPGNEVAKAALRAALAPLEINYVNSCCWRDRIEGGKQPLSHGQGVGTPG